LNDNQVTGANPAYDIEDAGVALTQYVSGAVGRVAPVSLPAP
jgi:hypothetical protein